MNGGNNNFSSVPANGSFTYTLGFTTAWYYVDMLINMTGAVPSAITAYLGTYGYSLTKEYISGGMYRVYGVVGSGRASDNIVIKYTSTATVYTTVLQFRMQPVPASSVKDIGTIVFSGNSYTQSSATSTVSCPYGLNASVYVYCANWKKYDYIDYRFWVSGSQGITSITAACNGLIVPVEVSILENPDLLEVVNENVQTFETDTFYYITVRVDLRNVLKTSTSNPCVYITGSGSVFQLLSTTGIVVVEGPTFEARLKKWFDNVTSAISTLQTNLSTWFTNLGTTIEDEFSDLAMIIGSEFINLRSLLTAQYNDMKTYLTEKFSGVTERLDELIDPDGNEGEIEDQSSTIESQSQQIQDFEQEQQTTLENGIGTLTDAANIVTFAGALAFVGSFLTSAFGALGSYQIVYTLPLVIGFILFIASRTRGIDKPNKSNPVDKGTSTGSSFDPGYTDELRW